MKTITTTAVVVKSYPPTAERPSGRVGVTCPWGCVATTPTGRPKRSGEVATHLHGIGAAGSLPDLGDRVAHCQTNYGRGYDLVDSDGLVPDRLEIVQAVTS